VKQKYALGIEFSTQSVKTIVLDTQRHEVVYTGKFDYDAEFSQYNTSGGVLQSEYEHIKHTSPFMLIEAVDFTFTKLSKDGIDLQKIGAIKIDAMQHCTVYTDNSLENILAALDPQKKLIEQIKPAISRQTSPIWEDRSTEKQAEYLTASLKNSGSIKHITGNRVELRFSATQIMKWAKENPPEYDKTSHIFLLSAFITSILSGQIAPVDTGDGWGTNLNNLDINNPGWSKETIDTVNTYIGISDQKDSVANKIGPITHYDEPIGKISSYFVTKYNFDPETVVLAGTGDNPATLLGCGGNIVISLGSSYTVNGVMNNIVPSETGEYNIFGYTKGVAMALTCFTNGGKLHETFLRKYILKSDTQTVDKSSWSEYINTAGSSIVKEDEFLMLPYLMDESVPFKKKGIAREGFTEECARDNIRSLHISQAISLKLHSGQLSDVENICIVGGGAGNLFLRQLITDIFDAKSYIIRNADFAAPLGCAVSAARYMLNISYTKAAELFVQKKSGSDLEPQKESTNTFKVLQQRYQSLENSH